MLWDFTSNRVDMSVLPNKSSKAKPNGSPAKKSKETDVQPKLALHGVIFGMLAGFKLFGMRDKESDGVWRQSWSCDGRIGMLL